MAVPFLFDVLPSRRHVYNAPPVVEAHIPPLHVVAVKIVKGF